MVSDRNTAICSVFHFIFAMRCFYILCIRARSLHKHQLIQISSETTVLDSHPKAVFSPKLLVGLMSDLIDEIIPHA